MKELYRVEHMTRHSYDEYMCGGYNYTVNNEDVLAESAQEAANIVKAMFKSHVINKDYIKTVAELEAEKAARKKEAERKAKKEEFEKAHPEIVAERKRKAKITRAKRAIKELEEQIAEAEKNLAYWKASLEELEKG